MQRVAGVAVLLLASAVVLVGLVGGFFENPVEMDEISVPGGELSVQTPMMQQQGVQPLMQQPENSQMMAYGGANQQYVVNTNCPQAIPACGSQAGAAGGRARTGTKKKLRRTKRKLDRKIRQDKRKLDARMKRRFGALSKSIRLVRYAVGRVLSEVQVRRTVQRRLRLAMSRLKRLSRAVRRIRRRSGGKKKSSKKK